MKCKACGASYKKRTRCPYCDTPNGYYRFWQNAEKKYFDGLFGFELVEEDRFRYARYRLLVLISQVLAALIVLIVLSSFAAYLIEEKLPEYRYAKNEAEVNRQLEAAYEAGDYHKIGEICSEYELFSMMADHASTQKKIYIQAYFLNKAYEDFCSSMTYAQLMTPEEYAKDDYRLERALREGIKLMTMQSMGLYSDLCKENTELYEEYRKEAVAYLYGTLGVTKEQIATFTPGEYISYADTDVILAEVKERNGWK